jgi:hypothetical protein
MKRPALAALIAACWVLCSGSSVLPDPKPQGDGMPTYQEFENKIGRYPYSASPERVRRIVAGISKVTHCMTKAQIRALLGEPEYSRLDYGPKGPGEKWLGSDWTFYISKRDSGANLNDPRVEIFFDTHDRAHWIAPTRIEAAHEIGGPSSRCD